MPSVPQGIIDFFSSPPLENLTPLLDENGPYGPGSHTFQLWRHAGTNRTVLDTYGVYLSFLGAIPQGLGVELGYDDGNNIVLDRFHFRLVQLVQMQLMASGAMVPTDVKAIFSLPFITRWEGSVPLQVGLYVMPGISVDVYYLTVA